MNRARILNFAGSNLNFRPPAPKDRQLQRQGWRQVAGAGKVSGHSGRDGGSTQRRRRDVSWNVVNCGVDRATSSSSPELAADSDLQATAETEGWVEISHCLLAGGGESRRAKRASHDDQKQRGAPEKGTSKPTIPVCSVDLTSATNPRTAPTSASCRRLAAACGRPPT